MWLGLLLAGCPTVKAVIYSSDTGLDATACLAPPVITHTPVQGAQLDGQDVPLDVTVYDYDGVASVNVLFKPEGIDAWRTVDATNVGGELWQAVIHGYDLHPGTVDYYIRATDTCGDSACVPAGCDTAPFQFEVVTDG